MRHQADEILADGRPKARRGNGHDNAGTNPTPEGPEQFDQSGTTGPVTAVSADPLSDERRIRAVVLGYAGTPDAEQKVTAWSGGYFDTHASSIDGGIRVELLRAAHLDDLIVRFRAEIKEHPLSKVVPAGKEDTDKGVGGYAVFIAILNFAAIFSGLAILNITLSSYLISSSVVLDYIDNPLRAFFFSALPTSAVFGLAMLAHQLRPKARKHFIIALGVVSVPAALVWFYTFSRLFAPSTVAAAVALPGAGGSFDFGTPLLFSHIVGEVVIAALLGLGVDEAVRNRRKLVGQFTGEFLFHEEALTDAFNRRAVVETTIEAKEAAVKRHEAARQEFIGWVISLLHDEIRGREAVLAAAAASMSSKSSSAWH